MKGKYKVYERIFSVACCNITKDGRLLSNIHFDIDYIGGEEDTWREFYKRANELYDVDLFDSISAPSARGLDPESGFIKVYRIQYLS